MRLDELEATLASQWSDRVATGGRGVSRRACVCELCIRVAWLSVHNQRCDVRSDPYRETMKSGWKIHRVRCPLMGQGEENCGQMELRLHSPVGADEVVYQWPLSSGRGLVSTHSHYLVNY